jgi:hypothetical protein
VPLIRRKPPRDCSCSKWLELRQCPSYTETGVNMRRCSSTARFGSSERGPMERCEFFVNMRLVLQCPACHIYFTGGGQKPKHLHEALTFALATYSASRSCIFPLLYWLWLVTYSIELRYSNEIGALSIALGFHLRVKCGTRAISVAA